MNYDTKEGIEEYLRQGLAGLALLSRRRSEAGYKRGERMKEWIVLGTFRFDTCGNTMTAMPQDRGYPNVLSYEEYWEERKKNVSMTSSPTSIPDVDSRCAWCNEGWTLRDVHDVHFSWGPQETPVWHHKSCLQLKATYESILEFDKMFTDAGVNGVLHPIPNGYGSGEWRGPWFRVVDGFLTGLTIGWRKRVINIDWSKCTFMVLSSIFDDVKASGDTVGATYVHAWSRDQAIDYLKRLWRCAS